MRKKNPKRREVRRARDRCDANYSYIISKKAKEILSSVVADILEESVVDARNLAVVAGKSCVTPEEMERSLRNLCLRLSTVSAYNNHIGTWNGSEEQNDRRDGDASSSKVSRTRNDSQ
ncbi:uncharacterized protein LOC117218332 [Megalopta genalis]|uniref:uncharacterized protein LOC117218332 n=1 Tax=Megalopta genalis TaxID=115081 RepID=UPI0014438688|nr:uncharacterized protein LOC117218332 [Megalopta genalis]